MAKAVATVKLETHEFQRIVVDKVTAKRLESVTLELDAVEVKALASVFYRVGGDPFKSGRGKIDSIIAALYRALDGLEEGLYVHVDEPGFRSSGSVIFHSNR